MRISDVLGKSFGILKANPKIILPYFIFTALIGILSIYFSLLLSGSVTGTGVNTPTSFLNVVLVLLERLVPLLILIIVLAVFVSPLIIGMYINVADQGYQKGTVSLRKALGVARNNYLNMLLLSILLTVIWIVVLAVLGIVFALPALIMGKGIGSALWLIIGAVVSLVILVVLALYLYEACTVVVLEGLGPVRAVSRSLQIGKQKLGLIFKVCLLAFLVTIGFIIADVIVVFIIEVPLGLSGHAMLGLGIAQLVNFLFSSVFSSWYIMIPVAFYKEYVGKGKAMRRRKR